MSQHQPRDTNAGGGVRRNTSCLTPTPEEEEYVATQDARRRSMSQHKTPGGGVCRNTRRRRRSMSQHKTPGGGVCRNTRLPEEEYVATQDAGGGVCRNTRRRRMRSTLHKTHDTNAEGGVCCHHRKLISYPHVFFPPKFSYFLYQSFNFFLFYFPVL